MKTYMYDVSKESEFLQALLSSKTFHQYLWKCVFGSYNCQIFSMNGRADIDMTSRTECNEFIPHCHCFFLMRGVSVFS